MIARARLRECAASVDACVIASAADTAACAASIETHLLQSRLTQQPHNVDSETASVLTLWPRPGCGGVMISGSFAPLIREKLQRRAVLAALRPGLLR